LFSGDEGGIAGIGEPFGLLAHIAVDAGEGLGDEMHELAGHVAGAMGMGILVDAREFLAHGLLGQSEAGGEGDQVAPVVWEIAIQDDVGEERLDHGLAAAFEEGLAGVGRVAGRGGLLAANPVDDGADIAVDQRGGGVEPVEGVEGAVAARRIDADDAAAMAMRAGVSMGASSDEGSRVTVGPR